MSPNKDMPALASQLIESLLDCDLINARTVINEATKLIGTEKVFGEVIPSALNSLGESWARGEVALTQIYAASKIAIQHLLYSVLVTLILLIYLLYC